MEAVSIITLDGIINVYTDVYMHRRGPRDVSYVFFSFTRLAAADAMPAFLEIQPGRVCYGMECYGRTRGRGVRKYSERFPYSRATLVFPEHRENRRSVSLVKAS